MSDLRRSSLRAKFQSRGYGFFCIKGSEPWVCRAIKNFWLSRVNKPAASHAHGAFRLTVFTRYTPIYLIACATAVLVMALHCGFPTVRLLETIHQAAHSALMAQMSGGPHMHIYPGHDGKLAGESRYWTSSGRKEYIMSTTQKTATETVEVRLLVPKKPGPARRRGATKEQNEQHAAEQEAKGVKYYRASAVGRGGRPVSRSTGTARCLFAVDVADADAKAAHLKTGAIWSFHATEAAAQKAAERYNAKPGLEAIVVPAKPSE